MQNQNIINLGGGRAVCIGFHVESTVVYKLLACGHRVCSFSFQCATLVLATPGKIFFPYHAYVNHKYVLIEKKTVCMW